MSASKRAMAGHVAEPGSGSIKTGVARAGSKSKTIDRRRRPEDSTEWSLSVDLQRDLARFLREEVTVILTVAPRPAAAEGTTTALTLPSTKIRFPTKIAQLATSDRVADALLSIEDGTIGEGRPDRSLDDGASWRATFLGLASTAMLEAAADLVERGDLRTLGKNTLSGVGNLLSVAMRRALLRWVLDENGWNMTAAGAILHLGSASNVQRAIKDLGLEDDLKLARRRGLVTRGGHKKAGPRQES